MTILNFQKTFDNFNSKMLIVHLNAIKVFLKLSDAVIFVRFISKYQVCLKIHDVMSHALHQSVSLCFSHGHEIFHKRDIFMLGTSK